MEIAGLNLITDEMTHTSGGGNCHIIELNRIIDDRISPFLISSTLFKDIFYTTPKLVFNKQFQIPKRCNRLITVPEGTISINDILNTNTWVDCIECTERFNLSMCATNLWKYDIICNQRDNMCISPDNIYLGIKTKKCLLRYANLKNLRNLIHCNTHTFMSWSEILEIYDTQDIINKDDIRQSTNSLNPGDVLSISITIGNKHPCTKPIIIKLNFKIIQ